MLSISDFEAQGPTTGTIDEHNRTIDAVDLSVWTNTSPVDTDPTAIWRKISEHRNRVQFHGDYSQKNGTRP